MTIYFFHVKNLLLNIIFLVVLISMAANMNLDMQLMDVVTAYLYWSLDSHIYMKIPDGFKIPEIKENKNRNMYNIKLQRSLYGLKQSGWMWYN